MQKGFVHTKELAQCMNLNLGTYIHMQMGESLKIWSDQEVDDLVTTIEADKVAAEAAAAAGQSS
jgi:hypothetical protein